MSTQTNQTTLKILHHLFSLGIFAWRQNSGGVYDYKNNVFRAGAMKGVSDICAVLPGSGRFLAIEVKTGKDKLSPEQIGFGKNIEAMGGIYLVVHTFEDFITKFSELKVIHSLTN